jgi:hypothetical protein
MRKLIEAICKKKVLIIGSAANPTINKNVLNDPGIVKICIKGSVLSLYTLDINPDIIFQCSWRYKEYASLLKNRQVNTMVFFCYATSESLEFKKFLDSINFKFENFITIYEKTLSNFFTDENTLNIGFIPRNKFIPQNTYYDVPFSFGLTIVLLISAFAAQKIILAGFNPNIADRCHDHIVDYAHHSYHQISDYSLLYYIGLSELPLYTSEPHLIDIGIKPYFNVDF